MSPAAGYNSGGKAQPENMFSRKRRDARMFSMDRRLVGGIVALALVLLVAGTAYLEREELVSA